MQLSTLLVLLGGAFTTLSSASPTPDLYERANTDPTQQEGSVKCGLCLVECSATILVCGAACGPGEILGPTACAYCLIYAGASQQCIQCVDECKRTNTHTPVVEDCSQATNQCTGASMFFAGGQVVPQGLCTIPDYAYRPNNGGGECSGTASACDVAVSATKDCKPVNKITRKGQPPVTVPVLHPVKRGTDLLLLT